VRDDDLDEYLAQVHRFGSQSLFVRFGRGKVLRRTSSIAARRTGFAPTIAVLVANTMLARSAQFAAIVGTHMYTRCDNPPFAAAG